MQHIHAQEFVEVIRTFAVCVRLVRFIRPIIRFVLFAVQCNALGDESRVCTPRTMYCVCIAMHHMYGISTWWCVAHITRGPCKHCDYNRFCLCGFCALPTAHHRLGYDFIDLRCALSQTDSKNVKCTQLCCAIHST